jgi:ATP-dependent protease ClpP protease subunit
MDTIIQSKVPINTVVDGCAASAATLMSVVGHRRYITKHSYILIHQLSSIFWGNYEQLKDDMENSDKFMKMIKSIYKEHTKIPMKKLDEILKHDLWFTAEEALQYGLVDEII